MEDSLFEDASPDPELLIKSIAEQGYSLETALADLIDNSIAANADKIEILINTSTEPFTLFLADNGNGMNEMELRQAMQFPSGSSDNIRSARDLGRFGLGLKTASFSQTRFFTVISKTKESLIFKGRSWNVNTLRGKGWKICVEQPSEIDRILSEYNNLSNDFLQTFDNFNPSTIVVWRGLYKFENYLESANRRTELKKEITEVTTDYLALVFHRFLERQVRPVKIRINNSHVRPFNPFPKDQADFRRIEPNSKQFQSDTLKIEGFILPSRSLDESKGGESIWHQRNKSLTDMEGMYIYRADRIILYGGWNGIIRKMPKLQLARLKVDIGNSVDKYFHLNVAKSSIIIPYDLRMAFMRYVSELRQEAEREYHNRGIRKISGVRENAKELLFQRIPTDRGMILQINQDFPLLRSIMQELNESQLRSLKIVFRIINTSINKIRQVHQDVDMNVIDAAVDFAANDILNAITLLRKNGISSKQIKETFLTSLGINESSLPIEIIEALKK